MGEQQEAHRRGRDLFLRFIELTRGLSESIRIAQLYILHKLCEYIHDALGRLIMFCEFVTTSGDL